MISHAARFSGRLSIEPTHFICAIISGIYIMTLTLTPLVAVLLLILTASGYAVATVGMKLASDSFNILALCVIFGGLALATVMEITLLRMGNMSLVYLGIVLAETALVLGYAYSIGHGLNMVQMGGAGMVLVGVVLLGAHA
jgi:hypothetical protein